MYDSGQHSGKRTCRKCHKQCEYRINALCDEHRRKCRSKRKASIYGQIRKIQYGVCDIYSKSHDCINHALL